MFFYYSHWRAVFGNWIKAENLFTFPNHWLYALLHRRCLKNSQIEKSRKMQRLQWKWKWLRMSHWLQIKVSFWRWGKTRTKSLWKECNLHDCNGRVWRTRTRQFAHKAFWSLFCINFNWKWISWSVYCSLSKDWMMGWLSAGDGKMVKEEESKVKEERRNPRWRWRRRRSRRGEGWPTRSAWLHKLELQ